MPPHLNTPLTLPVVPRPTTHQLTAWLTLLAQLRGMACDVDGVAAQARVAKLAYWRALCYLVDRLPVHVFWDLLPQGMGTDTAVVAVAPSLSPWCSLAATRARCHRRQHGLLFATDTPVLAAWACRQAEAVRHRRVQRTGACGEAGAVSRLSTGLLHHVSILICETLYCLPPKL